MRQIYLTFLLALMLLPAVALSQTDVLNQIELEKAKAAAEQGNAPAQYLLGIMYSQSDLGVPQDYAEAFKWFRLAAEQGQVGAQFNLGWMYDKGQGVPQNYNEALKWYRLAAEQGDVKAQYNLSVMYYNGVGVPQNGIMAYVWSSLAAAQGHEEGRHNRDIIVRQLTPEQLERGQDIAARCFASGYKDCN